MKKRETAIPAIRLIAVASAVHAAKPDAAQTDDVIPRAEIRTQHIHENVVASLQSIDSRRLVPQKKHAPEVLAVCVRPKGLWRKVSDNQTPPFFP